MAYSGVKAVGSQWVVESDAEKRSRPLGWWDAATLLLSGIAAASVFAPNIAVALGGPIALGLWLSLALVWRRDLHAPDVLAALLVLLSLASILWADRPGYALESTRVMAGNVALFLAIRAVCNTPKRLAIVATGFVAGAAWSVVQILRTNELVSASGGLERYGVEGINYNYSAYAFVAALACVPLLWIGRGLYARIALVGVVGLLVYGVDLTGARTALIGLVLLAVWVVVSRVAPRPLLAGLGLLILAASYGLVTGVLDRFLIANFDQIARASGDLSNRIPIWTAARAMWANDWLLGIGAGGFQGTSTFRIGPHNVVLEYLTSYGVVGVLLLGAFMFTAMTDRMACVPIRIRAVVVGGFLAGMAPAWLGGQWVSGPAAWVSLALISALPVMWPGEPQ